MPSVKPSRPPTFDAKTFTKRLHERVTQTSGTPYAVFDYEDDSVPPKPIGLPRFIQWVRGLRDTVNANAVYLDAVKGDVDSLRGGTDKRLDAHDQRLDALEGQSPPFPA